jgi:hypothetical protein
LTRGESQFSEKIIRRHKAVPPAPACVLGT